MSKQEEEVLVFIWASFHNESLVAHYLGVRARGVVILLISSGLVLSHTRSQKAFVYNKSKETTIGPCDGAWSAQSSRCSDARRRGRCSARPSTQKSAMAKFFPTTVREQVFRCTKDYTPHFDTL